MRIYEIDEKIEAVMMAFEQGISEAVDTETGEVVRLQEYLDELQMSREAKVKNLALYIKNTDTYIDGLKKEKKRIMDELVRQEKKIDGAKEYLKQVTDGKSVKDPQFTISYRKSKAVEIAEGAVIPEEYLVPQEPKVSKTELKKAIEAGTVIDGVSLVERINMSVK